MASGYLPHAKLPHCQPELNCSDLGATPDSRNCGPFFDSNYKENSTCNFWGQDMVVYRC